MQFVAKSTKTWLEGQIGVFHLSYTINCKKLHAMRRITDSDTNCTSMHTWKKELGGLQVQTFLLIANLWNFDETVTSSKRKDNPITLLC